MSARRGPASSAARTREAAVARGRSDGGQASIELIALVPLLVAVTLAIAGLLAGQAAREAADQAAVAAAIAQLQGGDAVKAAKAASPGWSRARVKVAGGRATVVVEPRVPEFIAAAIDAERSVVFSPVRDELPGASQITGATG